MKTLKLMDMIREVSERTGIAVDAILGRSRAVVVCCARHLYWKLLREKKHFTYSQIGRLNERNLHVVYKGIRRINELIEIGDKTACEIWGKMKGIEV